jgi:hypothetical protein
MKRKQTAVEWIELKLNSIKPTDFCSIETIKDWVKQAKQMEKEQIIDSFRNGLDDFYDKDTSFYENGEKYYNETYKQQDNG